MSAAREHIGWLLWCLDQGYSSAEDRAVTGNWLLDDEAALSAPDRDAKRDLLAMADEVLTLIDPLTTLRAEVIEARDEARIGEITEVEATLNWVLDLIDKHAREGQ